MTVFAYDSKLVEICASTDTWLRVRGELRNADPSTTIDLSYECVTYISIPCKDPK